MYSFISFQGKRGYVEESRLHSDFKKMEEKEITKEELSEYTGFSNPIWFEVGGTFPLELFKK